MVDAWPLNLLFSVIKLMIRSGENLRTTRPQPHKGVLRIARELGNEIISMQVPALIGDHCES